MSSFTTKPEEYTEKTFGSCIRERRIALGKSVRGLAKEIGMSPVYLSDIERGNRPAPNRVISKQDYMAKLVSALQLTTEEELAFRAMAEVTSDSVKEFQDYLARTPEARFALRIASEKNIPPEKWREFIALLNDVNSDE